LLLLNPLAESCVLVNIATRGNVPYPAGSAQRHQLSRRLLARSGLAGSIGQPYFSPHTNRGRFWVPNLIYAADGGTRPKLRGYSVSPALSCISFRRLLPRLIWHASEALVKGQKAAQERFSEESFRVLLHFAILPGNAFLKLYRKLLAEP